MYLPITCFTSREALKVRVKRMHLRNSMYLQFLHFYPDVQHVYIIYI